MSKLLCAVGVHQWEEMTHVHKRGDWDRGEVWLHGYECSRCKKRIRPRQFNWKREVEWVKSHRVDTAIALVPLALVAFYIVMFAWAFLSEVIFR
jgi:hypothetical protein